MIRILFYTSNPDFQEDLWDTLREKGFWADTISSLENLKKIDHENYDMFIFHSSNRLEFSNCGPLQKLPLPFIFLFSHPAPNFSELTPFKNLVETVELPIKTSEFMLKLKNIIRDLDFYERKYILSGLTGNIRDYSLLEVLQTFLRKSLTGRLLIKENEYIGEFILHKGKIYGITCDPFKSMDALNAILFLDEAQFEFVQDESIEPRGKPFDEKQLFFTIMEQSDEWEQMKRRLPDRYEKLRKNPSKEEDLKYLSTELVQLYRSLPDVFHLMHVVFHPEMGARKDIFENILQLYRMEFLVQNRLWKQQLEKKGIRSLWSRFFRPPQPEERNSAELVEEFESYPKKQLLLHLGSKEINTLVQLSKTE